MVQQGHYSELGNIIEALPAARAARGGAGVEVDADEEEEEGGVEEGQEGGGEEDPRRRREAAGARQRRARRLQTFVFSATLTLPAALRKRLRKGGGGATGSASLDALMDRIPFRRALARPPPPACPPPAACSRRPAHPTPLRPPFAA